MAKKIFEIPYNKISIIIDEKDGSISRNPLSKLTVNIALKADSKVSELFVKMI